MITLLIYFVVIVILLAFAYWVVGQLLPPPIQKFAYIVLGLIGVICVVYLLLSMAGGGGIHLPAVTRVSGPAPAGRSARDPRGNQ